MWKLSQKKESVPSTLIDEVSQTLNQFLNKKQGTFADIDLLKKGLIQSESLAGQLRDLYDTFCVLGIGGSSLGAQAVIEALCPQLLDDGKVIFFDNVDSNSFFRKLNHLKNPSRTLWILISKSGGTVETLIQADFIREFLWQSQQIHFHKNAVVITETKASLLYNWARDNQVPTLEVPMTIGGRFSVLTPVGTFLFALLNIPCDQLIDGASEALNEPDFVNQMSAQFVASLLRKEQATYFFSYCDDLKYWGLWLQQLWAESLGKRANLSGDAAPELSFPISCRGATDQHSVLQQIAEGTQKKFVCFIRVGSAESTGPQLKEQSLGGDNPMKGQTLGVLLAAEASAVQQALQESGILNITIQTEGLSARSIGYLLMSFQLAVATIGLYFSIDPFNQPGVERAKVLTRTILKQKENKSNA